MQKAEEKNADRTTRTRSYTWEDWYYKPEDQLPTKKDYPYKEEVPTT